MGRDTPSLLCLFTMAHQGKPPGTQGVPPGDQASHGASHTPFREQTGAAKGAESAPALPSQGC